MESSRKRSLSRGVLGGSTTAAEECMALAKDEADASGVELSDGVVANVVARPHIAGTNKERQSLPCSAVCVGGCVAPSGRNLEGLASAAREDADARTSLLHGGLATPSRHKGSGTGSGAVRQDAAAPTCARLPSGSRSEPPLLAQACF